MVPDLPSSPISPGPGAHFVNFSRPMSKPAPVPFDSRSNTSSTRSSRKGLEGPHDPLARALAPPPDETPEERAQRLRAEERAKKVSEDIDKYLKKDGEEAAKKKSATVRLLLLGQSESGKSTALKNFQLLYNPQSFQAERLAWRLVILFNLVHSIRVLHHIVQDALDKQQQHQEEADSRDVSLGKSPTSPLFTRAPLPDFHDLLPPMPDPRQIQQQKRQQHHSLSLSVNINHKPGSPPISPVGGDLDPDLTDGASSHSAGSSSNAPKQSVARRSSFFSTAMLDKKRSPERKRPATSTGVSPIATSAPTAFNLPIISPPTNPKVNLPVTKLRVGALSDDDYKRPDPATLRKTRSRDSLSGRKATIKANNVNLLSAGLESSTSLVSIREYKPNGQLLPQLKSFPDLKWNAQHRLLLMRIKPLLTIEADLLRRLSVPDEDEAVRLDFNLPEMHRTAVRVAIMGKSPTRDRDEAGTDADRNATKRQSNKENGVASRFGRSISSGGRPRARSSVDVDAVKSAADGKAKSLASESTSTLSTEDPALSSSSPLVDRRKSDDIINRMNGATAMVGNGSGNSTRARVFVPSGDGVVIPEFFVRSTTNWKEKLRKLSKYDPTGQLTKGKGDDGWEWNPWDDEMDPAHFIQACARNIIDLWTDPVVQEHLERNNYKMEHSPGFFLGDVERITSRDYIPTDDDILRARIKTIGVTEHKLSVDTRTMVPKEWLVYDVGGSRTQRAAWLPYFDTTDAIIFIASLSSFDQVLTEDPTVNRMEDSLRLFRTIVNSPILKDVNIILLLNKMDILDAKLQAGIQVGQHFKRYADRPNTTEAVTKYFRTKFSAIFEKFTPPNSKRVLSIHTTSLTNPKSTRLILEAVSETIIKAHMRNQGVV